MLAQLRILVIIVIVGGLFASLGACGKSPTSPTPPPAPLNLTGTWSGQLGQPGSGSALRITWVTIQHGDLVSGLATIAKPTLDVQGTALITGIINGNRVTLTFAAAPGSIQGFERCGIAGRGDASATTTDITGSIALLTTSCAGTGLDPAVTSELRLAR
jgi:hypothetical protein